MEISAAFLENLLQCLTALRGVLLSHIRLGIHQEPQVLLCKAVLESLGHQPQLLQEVITCQVQDVAFVLNVMSLLSACFSSLSGPSE